MTEGVGLTGQARLETLDRKLVGGSVTVLLLASFFPYIAVVPLPSDTQPYALMAAAAMAAAFATRRVRRELVLLFIPFGISLPLLIADGVSTTGIRSVANYASMAAIPYVTYLAVRSDRARFRKLLRLSIYMWLIGGVLQMVIGRDLFALILPSVRTTATRGVTSFAPEPTHYGLQCVFLLLLVLMEFDGSQRKKLAAILVCQILLLAQSTLAGLVLLGMFGLYLLTHVTSPRRLVTVAVTGAVAVAIAVVAIRIASIPIRSTRILFLASALIRNPEYLLLADQSGNARLAAILISFHGFFAGGMIPHGFGTYPEYVDTAVPMFSDILFRVNRVDRIMSGYGAALFELGAIGLLIPGVITLVFWRAYRDRWGEFIILSCTLHAVLLAAMPLANPVIGVVVGYVAFRAAEGERTLAPDARLSDG